MDDMTLYRMVTDWYWIVAGLDLLVHEGHWRPRANHQGWVC